MERLTEEKQIGPWASLKDKAEAIPGAFANYDCLMAHMTAVTRLKAYEDTGLEPERICEFMGKWVNVVELAGFMKHEGIEHLRDLVQAEKDGRLVVLPCKKWDEVWYLRRWCNCDSGKPCSECKDKKMEIRSTTVLSFIAYGDGEVWIGGFETKLRASNIGKTFFLTKEEAEEALKGGASDARNSF